MSVRFALHRTSADYRTTTWAGGTTTELAIAPEGASYADRTFLWRISSATVEAASSAFTPLPAYDRQIAVLRGRMTLRHDDGAPLTLRPYETHTFDGARRTVSEGRCTDFNLMLRKGAATGRLRPLLLPQTPLRLYLNERTETALLYCAEGVCLVGYETGRCRLQRGESLLLETDGGAELTLTESANAKLLLAEVWRA